MTEAGAGELGMLSTGVPGLDRVLGGGLAVPSLTLVAGPPGSGKTTLLHQLMFANARPEQPALYVTLLGEPPLKMLRYQAQFGFYDSGRVCEAVHYLSLGDEVMDGGLDEVLDRITAEMAAREAALVFVDSVHSVLDNRHGAGVEGSPGSEFLHRLSVRLTGWEATTFIVGEYANPDPERDPIFTVADGILWLEAVRRRSGGGRRLEVLKLRGREHVPGRHTFRITDDGLRVFPRLPEPVPDRERPEGRLGTGVAELDRMTGGGIPAGDAVLLAGPSGSGKSLLGLHFLQEGLRNGEAVVVAGFEEHPTVYRARASRLGFGVEEAIAESRLELLYLRPLDLSVAEIFAELNAAIRRTGARRVIVDSLTGCEVALEPGQRREELRASLFRLVGGLTGAGSTVLLTVEVPNDYDALTFSPQGASFLSDDILLQRYVEIDGRLERVMAVVKMRHSSHSPDLHRYRITSSGIEIGAPLRRMRGILTGVATPAGERSSWPEMSRGERSVLDVLTSDGESSAEQVAGSTGMSQRDARRTLLRLVRLGYVLERRNDASAAPLFRATSRTLGGEGGAP